jgi:hypothetical protein
MPKTLKWIQDGNLGWFDIFNRSKDDHQKRLHSLNNPMFLEAYKNLLKDDSIILRKRLAEGQQKTSNSNVLSSGVKNNLVISGTKSSDDSAGVKNAKDADSPKSDRAAIFNSADSETNKDLKEPQKISIGHISLVILGLIGLVCSIWLAIFKKGSYFYAYVGLGIVSGLFVAIGTILLLRKT